MAAPLDFSDRLAIESGIMKGSSLSSIAKSISRDKATISREILRNRDDQSTQYKFGNDCIHVSECTLQHVCGDNRCNYLCRSCKKMNYPGFCHSRCKKYLAAHWQVLKGPVWNEYQCTCLIYFLLHSI